jgi:hypothetical protein
MLAKGYTPPPLRPPHPVGGCRKTLPDRLQRNPATIHPDRPKTRRTPSAWQPINRTAAHRRETTVCRHRQAANNDRTSGPLRGPGTPVAATPRCAFPRASTSNVRAVGTNVRAVGNGPLGGQISKVLPRARRVYAPRVYTTHGNLSTAPEQGVGEHDGNVPVGGYWGALQAAFSIRGEIFAIGVHWVVDCRRICA